MSQHPDSDQTQDFQSIPSASVMVYRNPDVTGREMREGAGVLLLHTKTGAYHRLNQTGAMIWRMLGDPIRLDELERNLRTEVEEAPATLSQDLAAHVFDLAGRDLIVMKRQDLL